MIYHGITEGMAKEFVRDYKGTLMTQGKANDFKSLRQISDIMGIDKDKAIDFILVACKAGYMVRDGYRLPSYMPFPTLYKAKEVM